MFEENFYPMKNQLNGIKGKPVETSVIMVIIMKSTNNLRNHQKNIIIYNVFKN